MKLTLINFFFSFAEVQNYLKNFLIPVPADFPGQLYIRRAIVQKLKLGDSSSIPSMVMHLIPFLGPLHIGILGGFNELYKAVFQKKRNLSCPISVLP